MTQGQDSSRPDLGGASVGPAMEKTALRSVYATAAPRSAAARYTFAIAIPLVAGLGRLLFDPLLETRLAFLTFFPAVMFSGWFGGFSAGLLSTAVSALAADYFWFEPLHDFRLRNPGDVAAMLVFVFTGIVMSVLNESIHRGKARQEAARFAAEAAQLEARASERRLSSLIEAVPTAIVAVDRHGIIVFVNAVTERLFGYTRDELVGGSIERLIPERSRDKHVADRANFLAHPLTRPMGSGRDLSGLRKDGSEVPIEVGLNPVIVEGSVLVIGSIVDITERKRADTERLHLLERERQARVEADAANRSKDLFIASVSHELRTPLNALMGWARMLREGNLPPERVRDAVASIDRNAGALTKLVEDVVDMSRMATGQFQLQRQRLDMAALVRAAMALLEPAASARHLDIQADIESGPVMVDGDATRLRQVVWNLLSNAIKFTPDGGRVTLCVRTSGEEVEILVSDSGEGIAPEFLPHAFEPFAKAERGGQGLGLGLSIVHQLVTAHDGRITVTSAGIGAGAAFTVYLPRVRVSETV